MALVRWDPFRELTALQTEVNRLFSRVGGGDVAERQSWTPSIDVIETDDAIKLKAELAGMDPADISIEVQDNVLTVSGERRFEEEVKRTSTTASSGGTARSAGPSLCRRPSTKTGSRPNTRTACSRSQCPRPRSRRPKKISVSDRREKPQDGGSHRDREQVLAASDADVVQWRDELR